MIGIYGNGSSHDNKLRSHVRGAHRAKNSAHSSAIASSVNNKWTMAILGEYYSFRKIFRDLQKHVNVGLKLYQARRTDTDAKFRDLFECLDVVLGPLEDHQGKIAERAAE